MRPDRPGSAAANRSLVIRGHQGVRDVASFDDDTRTQNGHIRDNTRGVSRRSARPAKGPVCRRKCIACACACTHVTLLAFHGKGVGGRAARGLRRAAWKRGSGPSQGSTAANTRYELSSSRTPTDGRLPVPAR